MKVRPVTTGRAGTQRYHLAEPLTPTTLCGTYVGGRPKPGVDWKLCRDCSKEFMRLCATGVIAYDPLPFTILGKVAS